eukprot:COSAG02_NODE_1102_length_14571_cov_27.965243_9_plen_269_part_00
MMTGPSRERRRGEARTLDAGARGYSPTTVLVLLLASIGDASARASMLNATAADRPRARVMRQPDRELAYLIIMHRIHACNPARSYDTRVCSTIYRAARDGAAAVGGEVGMPRCKMAVAVALVAALLGLGTTSVSAAWYLPGRKVCLHWIEPCIVNGRCLRLFCIHWSRYDGLVDMLELPPGFSVKVYAEVPAARSLAYNPATGTVFVGAYDFSGIQGRNSNLAVYGLRFYDGEMFPPEYALVRSGCSIAIPPFLELKYLTQLYCCCSW